MVAFAKALPAIRAAVSRDLVRPGLLREKVLATVVSLLEATMIRVGNESTPGKTPLTGLTTLQEDHVRISGDTLRFRFRGKKRPRTRGQRARQAARAHRAASTRPSWSGLFQYIATTATAHRFPRKTSTRTCATSQMTTLPRKIFSDVGRHISECARARIRTLREQNGKSRVVAAIKAVSERLGTRPRCEGNPTSNQA